MNEQKQREVEEHQLITILLPKKNLPQVMELLQARYGKRMLADLVIASVLEAIGRQMIWGKSNG